MKLGILSNVSTMFVVAIILEFILKLRFPTDVSNETHIEFCVFLKQLWDCEYKPINPQEIRLPVPQPPSDRLLAAVEAFYSPPSHDRPRDRFVHPPFYDITYQLAYLIIN